MFEEQFYFQDFIDRLDSKQLGIYPQLRSYSSSRHPGIAKQYFQLDSQMQTLYNHLFKEPKPKEPRPNQQQHEDQYYRSRQKKQEFGLVSLQDILPFSFTKTDMPTCNLILQSGQHVYQCHDCSFHQACVWCTSCFEQSQHKGHRYTVVTVSTGTCDCGNPETMTTKGFCRRHKGKFIEPQIQQKERIQFDKYMDQIWSWILEIYKVERIKALTFLIHFCIYLDKLNDHSLVYNVLTERFLRKGYPTMLDHLLKMGSEHYQTFVAKSACQLFLKMFSLQSFKQLLAEKYIVHYNEDDRFQTSDYKHLFVQLFLNYQLIEKVIPRINSSLAPRKRECDSYQYNSSLKLIGMIKRQSAKIFFKPIIQSGGVGLDLMQYIEKIIENGNYQISYIYKQRKYRSFQNSYYQAMNLVAKVNQDQPKMLQKEILNQYKMSCKYKYQKNKAIIPHHRVLAMLVFVYFKCDLQSINAEKLMKLFGQSKSGFFQLTLKYLQFFLKPIKEFALTLANRDGGQYEFDSYIQLYAVDPKLSQAFLYDVLGLKVFAMILHSLGYQQHFSNVLAKVYLQQKAVIDKYQSRIKEEIESAKRYINIKRQMYKKHNKSSMVSETDEDMQRIMRHQFDLFGRGDRNQSIRQVLLQDQQKISQKTTFHFLQWIHIIYFLIETTFVERAQIIIASRCGIRNSKTQEMSERQMIGLFKNAKQLTVQQMQELNPFWFGKEIDKQMIQKVSHFDKAKKKYILKENIDGNPIFKDLLHSLIGNETYLKYTSKPIQLNQKNKKLRSILISQNMIITYVQRLFQHYETRQLKRNLQHVKQFAGLIKLAGFVIGTQNKQYLFFKTKILEIAQAFNATHQIKLLFQQEGQTLPKQKSQAEKKRLEQIKKKQKQKFKQLQKNANENIKKILSNQTEKQVVQVQQTDQCIICRGRDQLSYLGLYGESSFMYNTLQLKGTYPYFHCCFHTIHFACFLQLCKNQDKVACPLCKAVSNILLPSQNSLQKNPNVLTFLNQRIQIIYTIQAKNSQVDDLNVHLTKSFTHLFFLNLLRDGKLHGKKVRLYRIILQLLKKRYEQLSLDDKKKYQNNIRGLHQIYFSEIQASYPFDQLMLFVNNLALGTIKGVSFDQPSLNQLVKSVSHFPFTDIKRSLNLAVQIFGIKISQNLQIFNKNLDSLSNHIRLYKPPENVKNLLKARAKQEGRCKFGHNAVVCIICSWKGCGDCQETIQHSNNFHCKRSIFFNYITGGLIYIANAKRFKINCLYISQVSGKPWTAKNKEDEYVLNVQVYQHLRQSLLEENLTQFVTSQLKNVQVHDLF